MPTANLARQFRSHGWVTSGSRHAAFLPITDDVTDESGDIDVGVTRRDPDSVAIGPGHLDVHRRAAMLYPRRQRLRQYGAGPLRPESNNQHLG